VTTVCDLTPTQLANLLETVLDRALAKAVDDLGSEIRGALGELDAAPSAAKITTAVRDGVLEARARRASPTRRRARRADTRR
jgi:hypothetical protein